MYMYLHKSGLVHCLLSTVLVWRAHPFCNKERVWSYPNAKLVSLTLYSACQSDWHCRRRIWVFPAEAGSTAFLPSLKDRLLKIAHPGAMHLQASARVYEYCYSATRLAHVAPEA